MLTLPSPNPTMTSPAMATTSSYGKVTRTAAPRIQGPVAVPDTPTVPGGGVVNYQTLLGNDPILSQLLAGNNAQSATNLAQLQAARQRALIGYGQIPAFANGVAGDMSGAVDQTTRDLAQQNTKAGLSTTARLALAYKQAQEGSDASLAARGILHSGAYGQHATENLGNYNVAGDQAQSQLLDYLNGLYSGYQAQQQALQQSAAGASSDALSRIIAQIQAGTIGAGASPAAPAPGPRLLPTRRGAPQNTGPLTATRQGF